MKVAAISGVVALALSAAAFAGTEEGVTAFNRGEYATAFRELARPAWRGDREAQYYLARLYELGRGVEKNPAEAVHYFRHAAEKGHPQAQHRLGMALVLGEGVEQDMVEALKWFILAGEAGVEEAKQSAESVARFMTRMMVLDSRKAARHWKQAHDERGGE